MKESRPAFIFAGFLYFCNPMQKKNNTVRLLMLTLGVVLAVAVVCLQVLQYQQAASAETEQTDTTNSGSQQGEELLTMPACAQSTPTVQESSSGQHLILEIFHVEPDDECVAEPSTQAWTILLEKILREIISPNAP